MTNDQSIEAVVGEVCGILQQLCAGELQNDPRSVIALFVRDVKSALRWIQDRKSIIDVDSREFLLSERNPKLRKAHKDFVRYIGKCKARAVEMLRQGHTWPEARRALPDEWREDSSPLEQIASLLASALAFEVVKACRLAFRDDPPGFTHRVLELVENHLQSVSPSI